MNHFEKIIEKVLFPNIYVRAGGALTGGGLGYIFSKVSKDKKYKIEVPKKLHILSTITSGAVGAYVPFIPFLGTIGLTLLYGAYEYSLWERKTLDEMKQV